MIPRIFQRGSGAFTVCQVSAGVHDPEVVHLFGLFCADSGQLFAEGLERGAGHGQAVKSLQLKAAQEAAHRAPEAQDDIFHELTRNGLSVAVCPLPVLNQVNITVTDGKNVAITRNVAAAGGGLVDEIRDMKSALAEVAK